MEGTYKNGVDGKNVNHSFTLYSFVLKVEGNKTIVTKTFSLTREQTIWLSPSVRFPISLFLHNAFFSESAH